MKKNFSIIASLLLSAPLFADSLSDAFKGAKVNGEIKSAYVHSNFLGASSSDSIAAVGGSLGIVTDSVYGLKAGATFQTSSRLNDKITNTTDTRVNSFNASGAVLSEAYLEYKLSNTSLKAGRQFITTPLVSSAIDMKSSEAILKDSFEAYILTNTDIPNTTLVAGYVDKYQSLTAGSGKVGSFENAQDGAYTLFAKNSSVENLTLQAQYLNVNGTVSTEDKNALYLQADYKVGAQTLSAQYLASKDKSQASNAQDGKLFGLKATGPLGLGKLGYLVAYNTSTDKNGDVYTGVGEGVTDTAFTALPVHGGGVPVRANTDTLVGAVVVPVAGVTIIPYGGKSFSKTHPIGDVTGLGTLLIYPISKDLLFKAEYEHVKVEKLITENTNTTRAYLSYKF